MGERTVTPARGDDGEDTLAKVGLSVRDVTNIGRAIVRRCGGRAVLEDGVAAFALGAVRAARRADPRRPGARSYVVTSAVYEVWRYLAHERKHRGTLSLDAPACGDPDAGSLLARVADARARRPDAEADVGDTARVLEDALASLAPRDRLVVRRRILEDHTARDVARELGISTGRVRQLLRRAVRELRRYLRVNAREFYALHKPDGDGKAPPDACADGRDAAGGH